MASPSRHVDVILYHRMILERRRHRPALTGTSLKCRWFAVGIRTGEHDSLRALREVVTQARRRNDDSRTGA
jgi:hypothetical protein